MFSKYILHKRKVFFEKNIKNKTRIKKLSKIKIEDDEFLISIINFPSYIISRNFSLEHCGLKWTSFVFKIINNIGLTNGNNFCKWIYENKKSKEISIIELFDDETETENKWILYGCVASKERDVEDNKKIFISINYLASNKK